MGKERMVAQRGRISSHMASLNTILSVVSMRMNFITQQYVDAEHLRGSVDNLCDQTQVLESNGQRSPLSQWDAELLNLANETINDGETLYDQSVAGGSIVGDSVSNGGQGSVLNWLNGMNLTSRLDEGSAASSLKTSSVRTPSRTLSSRDETFSRTEQQQNQRHPQTPLLELTMDTPDGPPAEPVSDMDEINHAVYFDFAQRAVSAASEAFMASKYQAAALKMTDALSMIRQLPSKSHKAFDLIRAQYILVHCAYFVEGLPSAKAKLLDFVQQQPSNDVQSHFICRANHMLAQVHVQLNSLEAARTTCTNNLAAYRKTLGPDSEACLDSMALMSQIESLSNNTTRAEAFASMIPANKRRGLLREYIYLEPDEVVDPATRRSWANFTSDYSLLHKPTHARPFRRPSEQQTNGKILPLFREMFVQRDNQQIIKSIEAAESVKTLVSTMFDGFTLLHMAALYGEVEIATLLLDRSADPNRLSETTLRHWGLTRPGTRSTGASSSLTDAEPNERTTTLGCAITGLHLNLVRVLLHHGGHLDDSSSPVRTLIRPEYLEGKVLSSQMGNGREAKGIRMLQYFCDLGFDFNTSMDSAGHSYLHGAIRHGSESWKRRATEFLVTKNADVLARAEDGSIALSSACTSDIISILLRSKPCEQVMSQDANGMIPLSRHLTGVAGPVTQESVEAFLAVNPRDQVRSGDDNGRTPLHHCTHGVEVAESSLNLVGIAVALIATGADRFARDNSGKNWIEGASKPHGRLGDLLYVCGYRNDTLPQPWKVYPSESHLRQVEQIKARFVSWQTSVPLYGRWDPGVPASPSQHTAPLPSGWDERTTELGQKYYVYHNNKSTTWDDPRAPRWLDPKAWVLLCQSQAPRLARVPYNLRPGPRPPGIY